MKTLVALAITGLLCQAQAKDFKVFVKTINIVEAKGQKTNVKPGDNGRAIGPMQIHYEYWLDAVSADPSIGGKYSDCNKWSYSVKVVQAYLKLHAPKAFQRMDYQTLARIHNGGPNGHIWHSTVSYWERFKKAM